MRSMIIVTIFCLISTPTFACVFDTDCKPGVQCVKGECKSIELNSGGEEDNAPRERVKGAKYCQYDSDCSEGSRCIKGSGREGVCLGH
jgi:hypothetical protein